jgi:hypothetical protein
MNDVEAQVTNKALVGGTCYIEVQPIRVVTNGRVTGLKVVGLTQGKPNVNRGNLALKVKIVVPEVVFNNAIPEVTINVPVESAGGSFDATSDPVVIPEQEEEAFVSVGGD